MWVQMVLILVPFILAVDQKSKLVCRPIPDHTPPLRRLAPSEPRAHSCPINSYCPVVVLVRCSNLLHSASLRPCLVVQW